MKTKSVVRNLVKVCLGLLVAWLLVVYLFNRSSRRDAASLDLILSTQRIEKIELISFDKTNLIPSIGLESFLNSLNRSNRLHEHVFTKDQVSYSIRAVSQTNGVFWLTLLDSGIYKFGDYYFRLKHEPSISVIE